MLEAKGENMSHMDKIQNELESGRSLTGWQIMHELGCMNYKGRISDLKNKRGLRIEKEMIKLESGAVVAKYYMPEHIEFKTRSLFA